VIFQNGFAMSVEFVSPLSGATWVLTNIYAPCSPEGRTEFMEWFHDIDYLDDCDWLVVGDFNLIRRPSDRNKPSANMQNMMLFNAAISNLRLEELKLIENKFTWTNKQTSPLLERLDWFFASVSWMVNYPGSAVSRLSRDVLDHSPCLVSVTTYISKVKIFRFKNYWMLDEEFMQVLNHGWSIPVQISDKAKKLCAKFKNLRRVSRACQQQLSNLAATIRNNKVLLFFLDSVEEYRDLSVQG
jgi:hypothetical protein